LRHAQHKKKEWQPSKLERRVQDTARKRAERQLLRVSAKRFQKAQQDYLEWEAFSLWVRAIIEAQGHPPAWMLEILEKRCPGFLQPEEGHQKTRRRESGPLPLRLLEWIHNHIFSDAKREGWLDALIFHTVREPRSQRTWAYWHQCGSEWKRKRPRAYPSFEQWLRAAEKLRTPGNPSEGHFNLC
jgi:hypothetical protein